MNKDIKWGSIIPLIGGFTLGAEKVIGSKPSCLMSYTPFWENDKHIVHHYKNEIPYLNIDKEDDLTRMLTEFKGKLDIVTSTCPCAGLSGMNTGNRGADAPQNEWLYTSSKFILDNIQPKVLIGENAPGLFTKLGEPVAEKLYQIGKERGYSFSMIKTNSELHGVPQKRLRTFFTFWKSEKAPIMNYYNRKAASLADYIKDIPKDALYNEIDEETDRFVNDPTFKFINKEFGDDFRQELMSRNCRTPYSYCADNGRLDAMIEFGKQIDDERLVKAGVHIKMKAEKGLGFWDSSLHVFDDVVNTLAGRILHNAVHPIENRFLTIREMLFLMGHPNDFEILNVEKEWTKLSQNVPAVTAGDWVGECVKFVNGELEFSDTDYLRQDNMHPTKTFKTSDLLVM